VQPRHAHDGRVGIVASNLWLDMNDPAAYRFINETVLFGGFMPNFEERTYASKAGDPPARYALVEDTGSGLNVLALYNDAVLNFVIDYTAGSITGSLTGTLAPGSPKPWEATQYFTSFDPIQQDGTSAEGPWAGFEIDVARTPNPDSSRISVTVLIPEPSSVALAAVGLVGLLGHATRRRRR